MHSQPHRAVYKSTSELETPLYRAASWVPIVSSIERFHCTTTKRQLFHSQYWQVPLVMVAGTTMGSKHTIYLSFEERE